MPVDFMDQALRQGEGPHGVWGSTWGHAEAGVSRPAAGADVPGASAGPSLGPLVLAQR